MRRRAILLALSGVLAFSACATGRQRTSAAADRPSDANIAAIVLAANRVDILYATLARQKSADPAVLAFAQRTFDEHSALTVAVTQLAERLGLTPAEDVTSLDIRDDGDAKREVLRLLDGAAFDSAYFAIEFAYHERVWDLIEKSLIPSARHPELRALLLQAQPTLGAHKGHAMEHLVRRAPPSARATADRDAAADAG
jgi:putative membrane protein